MSEQHPTVRDIFTRLQGEGRVTSGWEGPTGEVLASEADIQPWYVRTMVGFGAWLASLLLIAFVAGLSFSAKEAGFITLGLLLMFGGVVVRLNLDHDFPRQMALAMSLAGQGLFATGVGMGTDSFPTAMVALILAQAVLVVAFPDRIHRFLSLIFATTGAVALIYYWEAQPLIHALVISVAVVFVLLELQEGRTIALGWGEVVRPVNYGLLGSAFGLVMLSAVYFFPELTRGHFSFYPHPWISTLGLGVLLLYLVHRLSADERLPLTGAYRGSVYAAIAVVTVAALPAPGILMALIAILLGFAQANRILLGAGIAFFVVFLGAYFYGMEISLLVKSMTLTATGLVLLAARYYLLRFQTSAAGGSRDA